jgi:hypothetical protein
LEAVENSNAKVASRGPEKMAMRNVKEPTTETYPRLEQRAFSLDASDLLIAFLKQPFSSSFLASAEEVILLDRKIQRGYPVYDTLALLV